MADIVQTEAPQEISLSDAGATLNGLLSEEARAPARPRDATGKFVPAKSEEAEAEVPAVAEGEEPEVAEEKPEGEEPETPEETQARLLKVKVDGIEQELPEDEVIKGYSRTADYTRKTQALAEEKRKFESEEATPLREERRYYAERVAQLEEAIQALAPTAEPDWNTLRPEDVPQAMAQWRSQVQRMEKIRAEREHVEGLHQQDENRKFQAMLAQEHEKLKAALPDMADAEKGTALKADLVSYAKSLGFSDDDLAQVTDHRVLVLLNKARMHDQAVRRKPTVEAAIDRALGTIKPSAATSKPKVSDVDRAKAQLAASGSLSDAANILNKIW